jgi:hypothetical protein
MKHGKASPKLLARRFLAASEFFSTNSTPREIYKYCRAHSSIPNELCVQWRSRLEIAERETEWSLRILPRLFASTAKRKLEEQLQRQLFDIRKLKASLEELPRASNEPKAGA